MVRVSQNKEFKKIAVACAIGSVGDTNAPAQAREALKLCGTYIGNIGAQPDAPERRRIAATNKALTNRLLSCQNGLQLLLACGFSPEPVQGEPEAYVCALELPMVRISFASLEKGLMGFVNFEEGLMAHARSEEECTYGSCGN